ncbi:Bax inhibitor-1/YccA family protein [Jonesia quinghaiensis]|uniref:Bax inhibitor-1/YccA family protein n=1 Tax=Jonesia quinghaiensis TaxID=262806 RepID=UPI0003FB51C6|nr:Bax inhibitor-1/YccA family protein [Jonesia quinghaiensis]
MSNPYFSNSAVFGEKANRDVQKTNSQMDPRFAATTSAQYGATDAASLENMYNSPAATTADTRRMTYDDVIMKTAGLLGLLVVAGVATWIVAPQLFFVGAIVGLVLGLVNAFKKQPSPILISLYAIAQGVFLGGLSKFYEAQFDGIVLQAVLGTVSVFAVTLMAYKSGKVRVTPKFTRILLVGMLGYLLFSIINVVLVWTGVLDGWGMRGGTMGIIIGLVAVGLAAMSLIVDFDSVAVGVRNGVPAKYAWAAAFGILVTLVWLYLELLRLIAILRGD